MVHGVCEMSEIAAAGVGLRQPGVPAGRVREKAGSTMLELKTFLDSSRLGAALLAGRINS
jgi:hypothetical protein